MRDKLILTALALSMAAFLAACLGFFGSDLQQLIADESRKLEPISCWVQ